MMTPPPAGIARGAEQFPVPNPLLIALIAVLVMRAF